MSDSRRGSTLRLSPARKIVLEILHHARQVPSLPLSRTLNIGALVEARRQAAASPFWMSIFLRAYGLTACRHPELRRAYIPWPRKHYYEHPHSECVLPIERVWQGEQVVLMAKVSAPENSSLAALDGHLRYFKEAPVLEVSSFRQLLRLGRLPGFIRRFAFSHSLYFSGFKRAKRLGTCAISSLGNFGVEQHHPLSALTTYFTFGPISPAGAVTAKIIYDHRVMDGRCVARCLQTLDEVLRTTLLEEVRSTQPRRREQRDESGIQAA